MATAPLTCRLASSSSLTLASLNARHNGAFGELRDAARLFHDLVVPFFGDDALLRNSIFMRSVDETCIIWSAVKQTSRHPIVDRVYGKDRMIWY